MEEQLSHEQNDSSFNRRRPIEEFKAALEKEISSLSTQQGSGPC
jgi:hypothetical protein